MSQEEREWLELGLKFHGHRCGGLPLGFRAGRLALRTLGAEREKDMGLMALVESGEFHMAGCWVDGIMLATGCTYGKGNIVKLFWGKWVLTLVDPQSSRAVRVAVRPELMERIVQGPFIAERRKGVPPSQVPEEISRAAFEAIATAPDEELFAEPKVFEFSWQRPSGTFDFVRCSRCGEAVVLRHVRVGPDGKPVCIPCAASPFDYPHELVVGCLLDKLVWPGR